MSWPVQNVPHQPIERVPKLDRRAVSLKHIRFFQKFMRDQWYADNRDLIKWSVLLLLARRGKADRIIQIAFLNPSAFDDIQIDGEQHAMPQEVRSHFRDVGKITALSLHPKISVFDCLLHERSSYVRDALHFIASFDRERCVVFLDPDTGLEPSSGGNAKHVLNAEIRAFWDALPKGWQFVFYQHKTNRTSRPWIEEKRTEFANAIGIPADDIGVASGPQIANDVVFFHVTKA